MPIGHVVSGNSLWVTSSKILFRACAIWTGGNNGRVILGQEVASNKYETYLK